jgi:hypothetical protein
LQGVCTPEPRIGAVVSEKMPASHTLEIPAIHRIWRIAANPNSGFPLGPAS